MSLVIIITTTSSNHRTKLTTRYQSQLLRLLLAQLSISCKFSVKTSYQESHGVCEQNLGRLHNDILPKGRISPVVRLP